MWNAGSIPRPPLRQRLRAEIKSPAICWEAKTSLSTGAWSLEQALMWQSLSELLILWGKVCSAPGVREKILQSFPACRSQAADHFGIFQREGGWEM